ncbi:class A beta-lactamase [Qipengyuania qiaonensis]|uniref:beta-lactamase n=1 Tax=Qipengyuania qiaonensis TaxID=2867240 RepID=A0ABS7J9K8_9SPHN|nr:class A beta-lactamase [Qipengyuania qiaonensis]MBX7484012.1 class A beta-lactamase [Qipengyuania qiaonensis]
MMFDRRSAIAGAAALVAGACVPLETSNDGRLMSKLAILERALGGRLGVAFHDPLQRASLSYRGQERFPMCSTFKASLAALALSLEQEGKLDLSQRVTWTKSDLISHVPFTSTRIEEGATLRELAYAAQTVSDNLAANLLLDRVGGPAGLTAFWRRLGDDVSRLDRKETELNYVREGDVRDTTTPAAMARTLAAILSSGDKGPLTTEREAVLRQWMIESVTGLERVRAGLPPTWIAGDKTGTSGTPPGMGQVRGDIGFTLGPAETAIFFAVYHQSPVDAPIDGDKVDAVLAQVGEMLTVWTRQLYTIEVS